MSIAPMKPTAAMLGGGGMSPWQAPLAALFSGLSAAGQPGGWSNFGAGVAQGAQNFQQVQNQQQLMDMRAQQMQMQEEELRTAEEERARLKSAEQEIAAILGGQRTQVVGRGAARSVPGQSAILGDMTPQQSMLFELKRKHDPIGALDWLHERAFAQPKDNSTDDQREYEFAKSQGYTGTFFQYQQDLRKSGASNNSTTIYNKDFGPVPPGFRLVETPQGVVMEAVPGSPAATDAAAAADATAQKKATQAQSADIVTQDIGRAIQKIEASPIKTTGFIGDMLNSIGGTEAGNVRALLDTVEANTAFDRLQEMRDASKTGGALGSITPRELDLLAATKGALQQSQDAPQLVFNLKRLNNVILDIVHGEGQGPERYSLDEPKKGNDLKSKYGLE